MCMLKEVDRKLPVMLKAFWKSKFILQHIQVVRF